MLILLENLAHAPRPSQGFLPLAIAGMSALSSIVGGVFGGRAAKKAAKQAADEKRAAAARVAYLQANRQQIINPYSGIKDLSGMTKDLSGMAKDLSGMVSNPYANLGVATQAAKMQAEEADMSLANTLDTLRETGSSAGGATALAQAALQSKKGISASIEAQEAQNEKLRAQGVQQLQQIQMSEAGRIQNIQMSEAGRIQDVQMSEANRMQQADVAGKQFVYGETERRQQNEIDRISGQATAAANREAQANADRTAATTNMISGLGSAVSGYGQAMISGATDTANIKVAQIAAGVPVTGK